MIGVGSLNASHWGQAMANKIPVITCDSAIADSAYLVYAAMKRAEIDCPDLIKIPLWNSFKASAWVWFIRAFEVE